MDKNNKKYSKIDVIELKDFCKHWVEDNLWLAYIIQKLSF
jgi:hypothetical protein